MVKLNLYLAGSAHSLQGTSTSIAYLIRMLQKAILQISGSQYAGRPEHGGRPVGFGWRHVAVMAEIDAPVALFVFNRPETTARVSRSFVVRSRSASFLLRNGPRDHVSGEAEQCRRVREIVQAVDWSCDVERNFSDANLGCGLRMSSGISWVWGRAPEAIFLEDDCLPSDGFFDFCGKLLERYRNDSRIGMISGDNFLPSTWSVLTVTIIAAILIYGVGPAGVEPWSNYDFALESLEAAEQRDFFGQQFEAPEVGQYFRDRLKEIVSGQTDTWDFQVTYSFIGNSLLTVLPSRNLVTNIGFGVNATHTHDANAVFANLPAHEPDRCLRHPPFIVPWRMADRYTERYVYGIQPADQTANKEARFSYRAIKRFIVGSSGPP